MSPAPLRLLFDVQGELREAAKECEAEVLSVRTGKKPGNLEEIYRAYESFSHFMAVTDESGTVVAAARLILPGPAGLKTLADVAHEPWKINPHRAAATAGLDLGQTLDATTFAVRDGLQQKGFDASHALLYGLFMGMQVNKIPSMVSVLDETVRKSLRNLGLIFHALPGTSSQPYFGSPGSEPVYAHLSSLMLVQRALAPRAHLAIAKGIGLRGIDVPERDELKIGPSTVIDVTAVERVQAIRPTSAVPSAPVRGPKSTASRSD